VDVVRGRLRCPGLFPIQHPLVGRTFQLNKGQEAVRYLSPQLFNLFFHMFNYCWNRKTPVQLAYFDLNIQALQMKALSGAILLIEPTCIRTREDLDALNNLAYKNDLLDALFRLVESQLHKAISHFSRF
jgi:hypothetical protein